MPLSTVLKAISTQESTWIAGETPLSILPLEERKRMLGLDVSKEELTQNKLEIAAANELSLEMAFAAPVSCDWRDQNGGNWITPVHDQGRCRACVAFATCAVMEARARISASDANLAIDLSENQLFFCGCPNCCSRGWQFETALDFAKAKGVAAEAASRYTPANKPCPTAAAIIHVTRWKALKSVAERKESLAARGPLVAGMKVFNDFYYYTGGVYRHVQGNLVGNHAVAIVGYDDGKGCWICKNSWSGRWGEAGFFRVAYGDSCGIDTLFPVMKSMYRAPNHRRLRLLRDQSCQDQLHLGPLRPRRGTARPISPCWSECSFPPSRMPRYVRPCGSMFATVARPR